jgi:uncharacterized membrane protein YkvA (DUF1232 family)
VSSQNSNAVSPSRSLGLWNELLGNLHLVYQLMRDPRVSKGLKIVIPAVVAAYILSPIDLIPDFIPVVGELDDLAIILLAIRLFIRLAPPEVVAEYRSGGTGASSNVGPADAGGETVDASYRVIR